MPTVTGLAVFCAHAGGAYLLVALLVAVDAMVPLVPAEAAVLGGAALAAHGRLSVWPLLAATWAGAVAGDLASYRAGRLVGPRALRRLSRPRTRAAVDRALAWLGRRGGVVLVAARFVPGGRTASTLAAGLLGLPPRLVAACAVAGGLLWSGYLVALGYAGARVLPVPPWLLAPGLALLVFAAASAIAAARTALTAARRRAAVPPARSVALDDPVPAAAE